MVFKVIVNK